MGSLDEQFNRIVREAKEDDRVLGLIVKGSRGKGLVTERSDYDLNLVVSADAKEVLEAKFENRQGIDLVVYTVEEFEAYAGWNTGSAWDRYDYVGAQVPVDKLAGRLGKMTAEKGTLPAEYRRAFVVFAMNVYLNATFRALKSLRDEDVFSARMSVVESIPHFLDALFGMAGRLRPYSKYLLWDLKRESLPTCPWDAKELEERLYGILAAHPAKKEILALLSVVEDASQSTGFSDVLGDWEKEITKMRSW